MKIDISAVAKTAGARMIINESGIVDDLKDVFGVITVTEPVAFQGTLTNINAMLHLEGQVDCTYTTRCDQCAIQLTRQLQVKIDENLVEVKHGQEQSTEGEQFVYQGNWLVLDKILSDSIALALPMRHQCKEECAIICPKCGKPVTGIGCGCNDNQPVDPRLAALKELYDHQYDDKKD